MGRVDFDFSDVNSFFEQGENEVKEVEEKVGKEAVEYAVQHGSYQNRTGTLRKSNKLTLKVLKVITMPRMWKARVMKY